MEELLISLIGIIRMSFIFIIIFCLLVMLLYNRFDNEICDIKKTLIEIKKIIKRTFRKRK